MAQAEKLFHFILRWEGGFVKDPADSGGATNMGVTFATFQVYCRKKGLRQPTVADLKRITKDQVFEIFKTMYWEKWKADAINDQRIANILVDWAWGSGTNGIVIPQKILGVDADGVVGAKTIAAVNFADPDQLFDVIYKARVAFLKDITAISIAKFEQKIGRKANDKELMKYTNKRFLCGWMNRLASIKSL